MVALKGKSDIGDQINKKILGPLAQANQLSDMPDFNDPAKLGSGKELVDRLTELIAIFENPDLNFSQNRADGDDLLGGAYEYLMRHFATESGKSRREYRTGEGQRHPGSPASEYAVEFCVNVNDAAKEKARTPADRP